MAGLSLEYMPGTPQYEARQRRMGAAPPPAGGGDPMANMSPEERAAYKATWGNGGERDRYQRANLLAGENINDAKDIERQLKALDMGDYTYKPTLDEGPGGGGPYEKYQYINDPHTWDNAINQVRTDSTGANALTDLLGRYGSIYAQGGLDAQDRARIAQSHAIRSAQARGAEQAIMADAAEQGRMGGNAQLLGRLQAQQSAANASSLDDLQTQALGLERRNALLQGMGTTANQIQSAQDAIDQFNTMGERDRAVFNANKQSRMDEFNASERNRGIDVAYNAATERSSRNADRTNEAKQFNVGPGQGARGIISDRMVASGNVANQRGNAVSTLLQEQKNKDDQKGAATQAWISAGTGLLNTGIQGARLMA